MGDRVLSAGVLTAGLVLATALAVRAAALVTSARATAVRLVPASASGIRVRPRRGWHAVDPPPPFADRLERAAVPWPAETVWRGGLAAMAAAVVAGWLAGGPAVAVVAVVAAGGVPAAVLWWCRDRADRLFEADLPSALEQIAAGLRSGAALLDALDGAAAAAAGRLQRDLSDVVVRARHESLGAALEAWADRRPLSGVALTVAALALGNEAGGAQARAVDGVASTLRDRLELRGELRALSSQARASAVVIAAAPVAFGAVAAATDARYASFLFRTPVGLGCLVAGLLLDVAGAWWMASLTRGRA